MDNLATINEIFKGTLVTLTALPPNTIIVRDSMHKVQGPKSGKYDHQSTNIDEINGNSNPVLYINKVDTTLLSKILK